MEKVVKASIIILAILELAVWLLTFIMPSSFKTPYCEYKPDFLALILSVFIIAQYLLRIFKKTS